MEKKWVVGFIVLACLLAGAAVLSSFLTGLSFRDAIAPTEGLLIQVASSGQGDQAALAANLERRVALLESQAQIQGKKIDFLLSDSEGAAPDAPPPVFDIPVGGSYILGSQDAPATIVVFSDIQCPYCSRFHSPIKELLAAYPGKARFVFKHFPLSFHKNARSAAKATMAAGVQGKFYEMLDLLFENQGELGEEKYVELAGQIGLDVEKFKKDLTQRDAEWEKVIQEDMALGQKVGVRGTPTFFLNGQETSARSPEQWKAAVNALLTELAEKAKP
ncbi:MAG: thioredoxin domain-containing protein [Elusimicrobia bacterium]|nr:thioredoxin domain-containing protein [Elusimicrobiota bacterium]